MFKFIGKLLCRIGIHSWSYWEGGDFKGNYGGGYYCKRCNKTQYETDYWF